MNIMNLLIPCATGLEATVKRQLQKLGYGDCPALHGRISLSGNWEDVARLNVFLRSGERVLLKLAEFSATTFDELFEGVFRIPWEEYLSPHSKILMEGKSYKSELVAIKATGGVAKKAVLRRLSEKLGVASFDERGERTVVGISIFENIATVTLDTSGDGLHKRGYRTLSYDAPLKETTAAALVENCYYRAGKPFADLFCGSGTLPIEAALYCLNIAPGRMRQFDFTKWKCAPKTLNRAREEAEDVRDRTTKLHLFAGDISEKAVSIARFHAKKAGVSEHISFSCADMRAFSSEEKGGLLLSNPPYGERLKENDLFALYRDFSRVYRRLNEWDCGFLTSYSGAERAFGRAERTRTLYNANLECRFYSYRGMSAVKK